MKRIPLLKSGISFLFLYFADTFPEENPEDWADTKYWYKASQIQAKLQQKGLNIKDYSLRKITQTLKEIGCKWRSYNNAVEFLLKTL